MRSSPELVEKRRRPAEYVQRTRVFAMRTRDAAERRRESATSFSAFSAAALGVFAVFIAGVDCGAALDAATFAAAFTAVFTGAVAAATFARFRTSTESALSQAGTASASASSCFHSVRWTSSPTKLQLTYSSSS